VILRTKSLEDRTVALGKLVQFPVNPFRLPAMHDLLSSFPVPDLDEGIVQQAVVDLPLPQLARQPVVTVEVALQTAWQPGRHSHITQAELLVDEVEIVVQALAVIRQQIGLARLLVVPWLVGRARLHRREDTYQSWLVTSLVQNLLHPVFLANVPLAKKLDLEAVLGGKTLGVFP